MEIQMTRILILPGQTVMQAGKAMPADTPLNLLQGFPLTYEDTHCFAVQRVRSLQLTNGEVSGKSRLTHANHIWNNCKHHPRPRPSETPFWG